MSFSDVDALAGSLRDALEPGGSEIAATQAATWIALSVRQLANADRLSRELQRRPWPVRLHWRLSGERLGPADAHRYADFYELSGSRATSLTTLRLCGMLIHSLVLAPTFDGEGAPQSLRFNTVLTRDEGLFAIDWTSLARLVEATCDEIVGSGVIHGA